mgnify:CR=1 FL=1
MAFQIASVFKTLVLSALYNLSDDQIEYQVRDRLSFMRFLGLGLADRVPDAKTVPCSTTSSILNNAVRLPTADTDRSGGVCRRPRYPQ